MPGKRNRTLHLAAAGVMVAGSALALEARAAGPAGPDRLKDHDDCPQAAAIAIPNLIEARKSGNEAAATGPSGLKAPAKKAGKKRTAKKAAKKAVRKKPGRLKSAVPKAKKKAAPRRNSGRNPC